MGNYLDKDGLTRFKEKMLTEVDKRIATGGGSTSGGDVPTKEEIIEGATRVTDVEVNPEVATVERLQTAISALESNLSGSDKLDKTTVHLVETWVDGDSWYRIYSDGWCEQGGFVNNTTAIKTVSLLKSYVNTNYSVFATSIYSTGDATLYQPHVDTQTTTTFKVASYGERGGATNTNGQPIRWQACGYIS